MADIHGGFDPDYFYTIDEDYFPFYECTGSLTIGDNVESIPDYIFCYNSFSGNLTIGSSVAYIGEFAFKDSAFDNIYFNAVNCDDYDANEHNINCLNGNPGGGHQIGLGMLLPGFGELPSEYTRIFCPFYSCFGKLHIGNDVLRVPAHMFEMGCYNGISIGNSVEEIGDGAFYGCSYQSMGKLYLPNSVEIIGEGAFNMCYFTGLSLGNSIKTIGDRAFSDDRYIVANLDFSNTLEYIGRMAFADCRGLHGDLIIPINVKYIGMEAFRGCFGFAGEDLLMYNNGSPLSGYVYNVCSNAFMDCGFGNIFSINRLPPSLEDNVFDEYFSTATFYYPIEFTMNYIDFWAEGSPGKFDNTVAARYYTSDGDWTRVEMYNAGVTTEGWAYGYPEDDGTEHIVIIADCNLKVSKNIEELYIVRDGGLTIGSGVKLTVNGSVVNRGARGTMMITQGTIHYNNLCIKDRGQLLNYSEGVKGIVEKGIITKNNSKGDPYWQFVASPMTGEHIVGHYSGSGVSSGESNELAIFRFNQAAVLEWENQQEHNFKLESGRGYLVASNYVSYLTVEGEFRLAYDGNDPYATVDLDYTEENPGISMRGWNLVGNPFPSDAYIDRPYYVIDAEGKQLNPTRVDDFNTTVIPSCTGVMVKAETAGESVHFSKTALEPETSVQNNGYLNITATRMNQTTRDAEKVDRVIVSFNEGYNLPKFYFNEDDASIALVQNDKEYGIAVSDMTGEMPMQFKAPELGRYTINVDIDEAELGYLHLIDMIAGEDIDLLMEPSYTFVAKGNDNLNRFKLVFKSIDAVNAEENDIFAYQNGNDVVVTGEGELQIFDVMGRLVATQRVNGVERVSVAQNGVYIFRMDGKSQKIVVR